MALTKPTPDPKCEQCKGTGMVQPSVPGQIPWRCPCVKVRATDKAS